MKILNSIGGLTDRVLSSLLSFVRNLGPAIESFVNSAIRSVTKLINFMISGLEFLVNSTVVRGINAIVSAVNIVPGVNISRAQPVYFDRFVPRLKTGAIINYPNHGVPVAGGRAIGGEAGAEGIIPLTDDQAMEQLGEAIGRYINVAFTNNTILDGELIRRQTKNVTNRFNLATNGGVA